MADALQRTSELASARELFLEATAQVPLAA
jgi:hypothetical protein